MKLAIFACLLALALARPQAPGDAQTLRSENIQEGNGVFQYNFETDNGIVVEANGTPNVEGSSDIVGSYKFPLGNGQFLEVTYTADANGFRPSTRYVSQRK
ncbi:cuticle protein AMP4-like [Portunus trituberculatus]|uniref:cuticle protein AMP4-like n=1 Tax=Portunus trituberculatus TaxID=210409 RepID=UPI001E1CDDD7|nr:cuticle protein AMP4-like [Portunus trituberculatus]